MKRCATCKHWETAESERYGVAGIGKCKAVVQLWDSTRWDANGERRELKPEYIGRLAFVQDGSDYYAELKTMASFGCVQHEVLT